MKKLFSMIVMISIGGYATAQMVLEKNVPKAVTDEFTVLYPTIKGEKWEKKKTNYEASFDQDKMEMKVSFTPAGALVCTKEDIEVSALPEASRDYMEKTYPGKKGSDACKETTAGGKVSYKVKVDENKLTFDADGKFVSVKTEEKAKAK